MDFAKQIQTLLKEKGVAQPTLEVPPDYAMGDFALPCFLLAKELKKSPQQIASELAAGIHAEFLERVEAKGPYVNFFVRPSILAKTVLTAISQQQFWEFGKQQRRVLIEYPSPNTNKPLHLGHVRNLVLGSTLARLLLRDGATVIQVNLTNDRGVHICKSMLAYKLFGNNAEPREKSDHFVGEYYVRFQKEVEKDPTLEQQAQAMLVDWENGDPSTIALWMKMNAWALAGQQETYQRYGISFDKEYFESEIYQEGKKIILEHKEKFLQDETGAIIAPLAKYKLPDKVLLRKDGTSIYITQDIALTIQKMKEFNPDLQIWVVGNEQNLHFAQLFAILDLMGVKGKESFYHLSYGMVSLPDGKMKSREGRVVDADDILTELEVMAAQEIAKRHDDWDEERIRTTAKSVAMGAIRFFMNKYDPAGDFVFDPKSSLSFEGDTGPYLQYTHARICSILAKHKLAANPDVSLLCMSEEQEVIRQLRKAPALYNKAVIELKPHHLAVQLLEIARAFNGFYHACPVLSAEPSVRDARLQLLDATRSVLSEGLNLLGIDAPMEM